MYYTAVATGRYVLNKYCQPNHVVIEYGLFHRMNFIEAASPYSMFTLGLAAPCSGESFHQLKSFLQTTLRATATTTTAVSQPGIAARQMFVRRSTLDMKKNINMKKNLVETAVVGERNGAENENSEVTKSWMFCIMPRSEARRA